MMTSNRRRSVRLAFAAACVAGASASAFANPMSAGGAFLMPADGEVSISFKSSDAGATGALYFLGAELDGNITYAASTDARDLGQFLFSNKSAQPGVFTSLGLYSAGTRLHFAYFITSGVDVAPTGTLSRSDVESDLLFFGQSDMAFTDGVYSLTFGVEDIKNLQTSDFDYNDAMFTLMITPQSVPSPGAISLAVCSGLFLFSRSRNRRAS